MAFSGARLHPAGTGPGPVVAAQAVAPPPTLSLIDYDDEHCEERECLSVAEAMYYFSLPTITWLHVHGAIRPE